VCDDDAIDLRTLELLGDSVPERPHALHRHVGPGKRAPLLDLDVRHLFEAARCRENIAAGERGNRAPREGVVAHGDSTAGEEDWDQGVRGRGIEGWAGIVMAAAGLR
jgi:hypothetical protein